MHVVVFWVILMRLYAVQAITWSRADLSSVITTRIISMHLYSSGFSGYHKKGIWKTYLLNPIVVCPETIYCHNEARWLFCQWVLIITGSGNGLFVISLQASIYQSASDDITWSLWHQKQISQAGISDCIPQYSVGCNYLSLPDIPASGAKGPHIAVVIGNGTFWICNTRLHVLCNQSNTKYDMYSTRHTLHG